MGLIRNEFVCLKKVANFCLAVGTRFSKLERIGIILEMNHGSDGFNPERVWKICLFVANFPLVVGTRFSKLERIGINLNNIGDESSCGLEVIVELLWSSLKKGKIIGIYNFAKILETINLIVQCLIARLFYGFVPFSYIIGERNIKNDRHLAHSWQ